MRAYQRNNLPQRHQVLEHSTQVLGFLVQSALVEISIVVVEEE